MNTVKIGKFIAENRKSKNMTQEQLGNKIGVTAKTISRWENGNYMPDISMLKPLSQELSISLNELLSGEHISDENYQKKLEENIIDTIDYKEKNIRKKMNGIYLFIVIILSIALGTMTYYYDYMRNAYKGTIGELVNLVKETEESNTNIDM